MADAGRPRKPTAVKAAQGTLEKSRTSPAEPEWKPGSDKPPPWLSGAALNEWKRLVPLLLGQGLFPASAYSQVAGLCQQWGRWREAEDAMAQDGKVIETASGYQQPSPWIAIGAKAWDNYMTACGRFGLDPANASKVTARPPSTNDDELARRREERRAAR